MNRFIMIILVVIVGFIGCCTGTDTTCSACAHENSHTAQSLSNQQVNASLLKTIVQEQMFPQASQPVFMKDWALDCFLNCISTSVPLSDVDKIRAELADTYCGEQCSQCGSTGELSACGACDFCISAAIGYKIGDTIICAQECYKNR